MPGLTANVTVTRDANGVPHIVANDLQDLYMAQGYVHAQDRLYQMFFFRTAGQGRLSELFMFVSEKMPKNEPGSLTPEEYAQAVAYILKMNGLPVGENDLPTDTLELRKIRIETVRRKS